MPPITARFHRHHGHRTLVGVPAPAKRRRAGPWVSIVLALGCGDDANLQSDDAADDGPAAGCEVGRDRGCLCAGGLSGTQTCLASGFEYGPCDCSGGSAGGVAGCGDGRVGDGEDCDAGDANGLEVCQLDCTAPPTWEFSMLDPEVDVFEVTAIADDGARGVYVGGEARPNFDRQLAVSAYTADLTHRWTRSYDGRISGAQVLTLPGGDVVVAAGLDPDGPPGEALLVLRLAAADGVEVWRYDGANVGSSALIPASDGTLFSIGGFFGAALTHLDTDGRELDFATDPEAVYVDGHATDRGDIIVAGLDASFEGPRWLRRMHADGTIVWQVEAPTLRTLRPAAWGSVGVGSSGGALLAFDPVGRVLWTAEIEPAIGSRPTLLGAVRSAGRVVFAGQEASPVSRFPVLGIVDDTGMTMFRGQTPPPEVASVQWTALAAGGDGQVLAAGETLDSDGLYTGLAVLRYHAPNPQ